MDSNEDSQPKHVFCYTDRQMAIMEFIQVFRSRRKLSPTLEEIAQNFGVSKVTVYDHVKQLEKKQAIRREKHQSRSIQILDPDYLEIEEVERPSRELEPSIGHGEVEAGHSSEGLASAPFYCPVNVLGNIAAGEPIEALEHEEIVDLADLLPMGNEHYALRVQGDSMIDEGIHSGDLVIVERRTSANDGEVVVAILPDNHATLKKLFRVNSEAEIASAHMVSEGRPIYRLQPANEDLDPIYTSELEVRGVVVGVVRKLN